jgi:hypothetical protein
MMMIGWRNKRGGKGILEIEGNEIKVQEMVYEET